MSNSNASTVSPHFCPLAEIAFPRADQTRVDEQAGIIYGVKVLGLESLNKGRTLGLDRAEFGDAVDHPYRYAPQALRDAAGLYEGIGVYLDHPESALAADGRRVLSRRERKTIERFGRLVNVRASDAGLFADLEYLKAHPQAAMVAEAARRMPETLGLSHNAVGRPALREGRIVIEQILDVRSVDLVGERPGTTHGLFESSPAEDEPAAKTTLRALLEETAADVAERPWLAELLARDGALAEVELPAGEPAADAAGRIQQGLRAAIAAKMRDAGPEALLSVLVALGLADEPIAAAESAPAAPSPATPAPGEAILWESVALLAEAGLPAQPAWLDALRALPSTQQRRALVATLSPPPRYTPRSQSPARALTETSLPGSSRLDVSTPSKAIAFLRGN